LGCQSVLCLASDWIEDARGGHVGNLANSREHSPGETTELRRHICHTRSPFIHAYVFSGELRSEVDGELACVYRSGEPDTEPARPLAVFIVDE
jgi:hypothetical protein